MIARLKSNLLCPHVNRNTFRTSSSRFGEWFGAHGALSFSFCGRQGGRQDGFDRPPEILKECRPGHHTRSVVQFFLGGGGQREDRHIRSRGGGLDGPQGALFIPPARGG